jgi:hypothetical protein
MNLAMTKHSEGQTKVTCFQLPAVNTDGTCAGVPGRKTQALRHPAQRRVAAKGPDHRAVLPQAHAPMQEVT